MANLWQRICHPISFESSFFDGFAFVFSQGSVASPNHQWLEISWFLGCFIFFGKQRKKTSHKKRVDFYVFKQMKVMYMQRGGFPPLPEGFVPDPKRCVRNVVGGWTQGNTCKVGPSSKWSYGAPLWMALKMGNCNLCFSCCFWRDLPNSMDVLEFE